MRYAQENDMNITHGKLPFLAALALGATLVSACGSAPPPPPPPPPPPVVVVAPPAPPPPPAAPALPLLGAELDIKGDIEFDVGKANIRDTPGSQGVLNQLLGFMKTFPQLTKIRVEGHTDSDGSAADNLVLSENRAKSVIQWMVDHGVAANRFGFAGCAAKDPLVPNDSPEHKQRNRRTEFDLETLDGKAPPGYTTACAHNTFRK
jgi:OmpA-OmpF porin, OOP family